MLLLALALRTDGDEVKQHEKTDEEHDLENVAAGRCGGRRLSVSAGDKHGDSLNKR